ncbi:MAG: hypothetical protein ABI843_12510 [Dokdonella sp.]
MLALTVCCSGCPRDLRVDFAFDTLFRNTDVLNVDVYQHALDTKFPAGTPLSTLDSYVSHNRGSGSKRTQEHAWYEIPLQTKPCATALVGLDVTVTSDAMKDIKASVGGLGC